MIRPRRSSLTTPFSQISVVAHRAAKHAPMMKRAANHMKTLSKVRIAPKQRNDRAYMAAASRATPKRASSPGRKGPTNRIPAPARDALSPIAQFDKPCFSSASEK